mgnify:CR=1 FL=1
MPPAVTRCIPFSATSPSMSQPTPCIVSGSWPSRASVTKKDRSPFSSEQSSKPCSLRPTSQPGPDVVIGLFCYLRSRLVCGFELISLRCQDVRLGTGAYVCCLGKGRKQRSTPLRKDAAAELKAWLHERHGAPDDPVFPSTRGTALSRDAEEKLVKKHTAQALAGCPSLKEKTISSHVLRHTTAMELLHTGVDRTVIALWLGHESPATTQIYLHADMKLKEKALSLTTPLETGPERFQPNDELLTFLENL